MIRLAARLRAALAVGAALLAHAGFAAGAPEAERRFDLSVNNAPAAQVFMQMAANTPYNVLVSPEVAGNVSANTRAAYKGVRWAPTKRDGSRRACQGVHALTVQVVRRGASSSLPPSHKHNEPCAPSSARNAGIRCSSRT